MKKKKKKKAAAAPRQAKKKKRAASPKPAAKRKKAKGKRKAVAEAAPVSKRTKKARVAPSKPTDPLKGFLVAKGTGLIMRASFDGAIELGDFPFGEAMVFETKAEAQGTIDRELERFKSAFPATDPGTASKLEGAVPEPVKAHFALTHAVETVPARAGDEYRIVASVVRVSDSPISLSAAIKAHGDEFRRQHAAAKEVAKQLHNDAITAYNKSVDAEGDVEGAMCTLEEYLAWAKYDAKSAVVTMLG